MVTSARGMTASLYSLLAIDDDETWYRNVVRRQARREATGRERRPGHRLPGDRRPRPRRAPPRAPRRQRAEPRRAGCARVARLESWETDWSSQTGACQAGLLHGDNHDMPAFRWWEKDRGAAIVTNHPRDAEELERRHSDGRGLLHADGASRANILSGDARALDADDEHRAATGGGRSDATTPPTSPAPYAVARTLVLALADMARERSRRALASGGDDVRPRIARAALLRGRPRLGDRRAARPAGRRRGRRHARRAARRSTRPSSPTTRSPTTPGSSGHDALAVLRQVDRQIARDRAPPPTTRRAPTGSSSSPTTARPRARPSCTATG